MAQKYRHTDNDGDILEVVTGLQGAVVQTMSEDKDLVQVAVHTADLPALIAVLQAIHDELKDLS